MGLFQKLCHSSDLNIVKLKTNKKYSNTFTANLERFKVKFQEIWFGVNLNPAYWWCTTPYFVSPHQLFPFFFIKKAAFKNLSVGCMSLPRFPLIQKDMKNPKTKAFLQNNTQALTCSKIHSKFMARDFQKSSSTFGPGLCPSRRGCAESLLRTLLIWCVQSMMTDSIAWIRPRSNGSPLWKNTG